MEYLIAAYLVPLYNFLQCWTGSCPPVFWPWA